MLGMKIQNHKGKHKIKENKRYKNLGKKERKKET